MSSTKNPGRFAGLLYVLTSIVGFFAMVYVPTKLIVHGNAAATASDNSGKVFSGGGCPAELHLLTKHLIETGADFFVSQEFPAVQLVQSSCHLLAEPCVMVDVVFHKLLHVFLCTALVFGGGPLHFRL